MLKERIMQFILISIITLLILALSSCATAHQQCAAFASAEIK
jgi:hypothetical protein